MRISGVVKRQVNDIIEIKMMEELAEKPWITIDERLDKDLVDTATERMSVAPSMKEILRYITYNQIERSKHLTATELAELQIPVAED